MSLEEKEEWAFFSSGEEKAKVDKRPEGTRRKGQRATKEDTSRGRAAVKRPQASLVERKSRAIWTRTINVGGPRKREEGRWRRGGGNAKGGSSHSQNEGRKKTPLIRKSGKKGIGGKELKRPIFSILKGKWERRGLTGEKKVEIEGDEDEGTFRGKGVFAISRKGEFKLTTITEGIVCPKEENQPKKKGT